MIVRDFREEPKELLGGPGAWKGIALLLGFAYLLTRGARWEIRR